MKLNLGIWVNLQKYFFVILFLSSIESNQKLFCSGQSEKKTMAEIFLNKIMPWIHDYNAKPQHKNIIEDIPFIKKSKGLYQNYHFLFNDFGLETFFEVFESFFRDEKIEAIYEAMNIGPVCLSPKLGQNFLLSEFGQAVQKAVALKKEKKLAAQAGATSSISDLGPDALTLYKHYQKTLGKFDESLFIQVFEKEKTRLRCKDFLVDVCKMDTAVDKNDIVQIRSWFGNCIFKFVLNSRRKKELKQLSLEFKSNPRINSVIQKMLEEINTGQLTVSDNFIPELLTVAFEHLLSALDNPSEGISFKRKLIDTYYDKLVEIFLYAVPEKALVDYNQRQKHIKVFIAVANANAIAKLNQILTGNLTPIKRAFKGLHQKEWSKINQIQQLSSVTTTKQAAEQDSLSTIKNNPLPNG